MAGRFFIPPSAIDGNSIVITGDEAHHIGIVMRKRVGELICLSTGDGLDYYAEITSVSKAEIRLLLIRTESNQTKPDLSLTAYLGALKGDKLDLAVQKLSELGAERVIPVYTKYTVVKDVKTERLRRIALESAKQCGRADVMQIGEPIHLKQAIEAFSSHQRVLFAYECEREHSLRQELGAAAPQSAAIVIGPEGGFAPDEAEAIVQGGGVAVSLGKRILRAETAAISLAAIVMYEWGEKEDENS
ncbi:MAG: 16S rRNA (uracil(1498)-N(3))-methyltransferase [Clostridia bacterium]|nr:16S rRNA (uracil(1498)-N(3))-methyltransferase [Clostridia bacterium]